MVKALVVIAMFFLLGCVSKNSILIPSYENQWKMGATLDSTMHKPTGNGPFPTVVLMHGCSGLDSGVSQGLKSHANFLVENGYAALILDSFTSRGKSGGIVCTSHSEQGSAREYRKIDAYNALRYLKSLPYVDGKNIFLMGQSNGGSVALKVASLEQYPEMPIDLYFNAVVAYYPWCLALTGGKLRSPVLVMGGDKDDWTSLARCEDAISRNREMGKPYEVIRYENAHHSFDLFIPIQSYKGYTVGGNAKARKKSKRQMLKWFERFRI